MSNRLIRLSAALAALLVSASAVGAAKQPWQEYDKQIQSREAIGTLGPDMFGDEVSYYNSTLSFSATDISLPGNNSLPVELKRTYRVTNHGDDPEGGHAFGDWEISLPSISGTFAADYGWQNNRCTTDNPPPNAYAGYGIWYQSFEFWQGNSADMPGGGELLRADLGAPAPTLAAQPTQPDPAYRWMTSAFTYFKCITTIPAPGAGEGFVGITADGTKYTFDRMAAEWMSDLASPMEGYQFSNAYVTRTGSTPLQRKRVSLYATKVEDRFGNTVTYSYSNQPGAPVKLDSITSSDGRTISLTWTGSTITSVTAGGKTWTYQYAGASLSGVTLPDTSRWIIDFAQLSAAKIDYSSDDGKHSCEKLTIWLGGGGKGTITHPSGLAAEFTVDPRHFGRHHVPKFCVNWEYPVNNTTNDIAWFPKMYDVLAIAQKRVFDPVRDTGPLDGLVWTYEGGGLGSWEPGTGPSCQTETCADPPCLSETCATSHTVTARGPARNRLPTAGDEWVTYTFGNTYRYNEGKLLGIARGAGTTTLETQALTYDFAQSGRPFKTPIGTTLQERGDGFASAYLRPQDGKITARDGVTFTNATMLFDSMARPLTVQRFSSLPAPNTTATDTTEYYDRPTLWAMGQVKRTTTNGIETSSTRFDVAGVDDPYARPQQYSEFGQVVQKLTYHTAGTGEAINLVRTVADGKDQATTLTGWYRGVPQRVTQADGSMVGAAVNDSGWIIDVTDELGTLTMYGYDAMGRLALVDYTNSDSVLWNSTNRSFAKLAAAENGIPVGYWKHTTWTGNGRKTIYLDLNWRPVLELSEDTGNAATKSFVATRYDDGGRVKFKSYPFDAAQLALAGAYPYTGLTGITTSYDALGRVTQTSQDAEPTLVDKDPTLPGTQIVVKTEYLTGFRTRVTNGRDYPATTSYFAFDTPSTDAPVKIIAADGYAEQQVTDIDRDVFGKPKSMTRSGAGANP